MTTKSKSTGEILSKNEILNDDTFKIENEKIKIKEENEIGRKIKEPIELQNELFQVKGSLKKNLSADYTLAHFSEDDRKYIIENYENAELVKTLMMKFAEKGYHYKWNVNKQDWERNSEGIPLRVGLDEHDKEYIKKMAERIFEIFMVKPHTISVLGRNKKDNFLVKLLGKNAKEDEIEQPMASMSQKGFFDKIKEQLSGETVEYVDE